MSLLLLGLLSPLHAHEVSVLVAGCRDLADRYAEVEHAGFGPGPHLGVGLGLFLPGSGARLQASLELQAGAGWDRIEWVDDGVATYDVDHLAVVWSARLLVGPGLDLPVPDAVPLTPYVQLGVGGGRVWTHHSFGDATGPLMDPAVNDLASPTNLDPYTVQWAPAVGGALGVRWPLRILDMALVLEAGYTVSFLPTTPVRRTLAEHQVVRADYGLNVARVGVGLALPL